MEDTQFILEMVLIELLIMWLGMMLLDLDMKPALWVGSV
jgi:hypothetical protein